MATTSADHMASVFLRRIGAPDTPQMRQAVIAWMVQENGWNLNIVGNNPWNITGKGDTGQSRYYIGHTFAVYSNVDAGVQAAADLLLAPSMAWAGYDRVVSSARTGDPAAFLNALAASKWDESRYGTKNGGSNHLIARYNDLARKNGGALLNATVGAVGNIGSGTLGKLSKLNTDPNSINPDDWDLQRLFAIALGKDDPAYVVQASDIPKVTYWMIEHPDKWSRTYNILGHDGFLQYVNGNDVQNKLQSMVGKPLGQLDTKTPEQSGTDAVTGAFAGIASWGDAIVKIGQWLADPQHWIALFALLAGVGLTVAGAKMVLASADVAVPTPGIPSV